MLQLLNSPLKSLHARHISFLAVDLAVLLVIGYAFFFRATFPDPGVTIQPQTGIIQDVAPHGFFERVGARVDDQLLLVNDKPWNKATSIYDGARVGKTSTWTLKRGRDVITLTALLQPLPLKQRVQNIIPLLVALIYWGIATILWLLNPAHKTIRQFFILSQLVALVLISGSLDAATIRWGRALYRLSILSVIPVTFHFFVTFLQQHDRPFVQHLIRIIYGISLVLIVQFIFSWFGLPILWSNEVGKFLRAIFLVSVMLLAVVLFSSHWYNSPPLIRQRRRLIIAGMLASILPLLLFYYLPASLGKSQIIPTEWLFFSLIFLPLAVAYALQSGELGTIDWFLNRTLVHILLFGLMAGLYAGLFWLLTAIFPQSQDFFPLLATLLAVVLAILFAPLHRFFQYWVDQLFYRGWYDYQSVVEQTGRELAAVEHPQELAQVLLENVTTAMKLHCACIVLPFSTTGSGGRIFTHGPEDCPMRAFSNPSISLDSPFHLTLKNLESPIETIHLRRRAPISLVDKTEEALLSCPYAYLWLPTTLADDADSGEQTTTLIVGPKYGHETFSEEDKTILDALARQTALVVRNLRLLIQLQRREEELVHLYKNLTYAREEERKRIARDLHDNIIQNIHVIYRSITDRHVLSPEMAEASLDESAQWLKQTMNDVRRICNDLRPAALDVLGLADALRSHADLIASKSDLDIDVFIKGDDTITLPPETENMLFRIAQEALWNIEKHADAQHVTIILEFPENAPPPANAMLHMAIQDDGKGFDAIPGFDELLARKAYGLLNMHERAAMIGGRLQIRSKTGQGAVIEVTAPVVSPDDASGATGVTIE